MVLPALATPAANRQVMNEPTLATLVDVLHVPPGGATPSVEAVEPSVVTTAGTPMLIDADLETSVRADGDEGRDGAEVERGEVREDAAPFLIDAAVRGNGARAHDERDVASLGSRPAGRPRPSR